MCLSPLLSLLHCSDPLLESLPMYVRGTAHNMDMCVHFNAMHVREYCSSSLSERLTTRASPNCLTQPDYLPVHCTASLCVHHSLPWLGYRHSVGITRGLRSLYNQLVCQPFQGCGSNRQVYASTYRCYVRIYTE